MIDNPQNYAQMLYQNFMGMSPGNLAQTAQGVANGSQPAPTIAPPQQGAQLSPNMQLYLQNLAKPSPYTQGLKPLPEVVKPPEFDSNAAYDNLFQKWWDSEANWKYAEPNRMDAYQQTKTDWADLDPEGKLAWLNNYRDFTSKHMDLDLRAQQNALFNSGLSKITKDQKQWEKDHKQKTPMAQIYANPLW